MSMPLDQQPPPGFVLQQNANPHSPHGSIGAVVAVLVVVIILGVVAVVIGRLCSGRSIMGYGHYDLESWAETKCSSCIDGRINPPLSRPNVSCSSVSTSTPAQTHQGSELQQEEQSPQTPQPANLWCSSCWGFLDMVAVENSSISCVLFVHFFYICDVGIIDFADWKRMFETSLWILNCHSQFFA